MIHRGTLSDGERGAPETIETVNGTATNDSPPIRGFMWDAEQNVPVTVEDERPDVNGVKSSLRRLAGPDDRQIAERAAEAVEGLEAAAAFVERVDLEALESALERVDDPELESRGRQALESFRAFRRAAAGEAPDDHFHSGRGTDLRADPEAPTR